MKPLTKIIIALAIPAIIVIILVVMISYSNTPKNNNSNNTTTMNTIQEGLTYLTLTEPDPNAPMVEVGDKLVVNYEGKLTDGTIFDSSFDRGTPFDLQIGVGQVIQGWDKGLIGMRKGEVRELTIAPELGYGSRGSGADIPPNATLIFKVEIVDIVKE